MGFLYIRKKIPLPEYIHGGKQERDHRAGTENVPGIAGMGKAAEIAFTTREYREKEIQQLRDYLIQRLQRGIPYCRLNGSLTNRLPGNCNISFQFIEGNELLLLLDEKISAPLPHLPVVQETLLHLTFSLQWEFLRSSHAALCALQSVIKTRRKK